MAFNRNPIQGKAKILGAKGSKESLVLLRTNKRLPTSLMQAKTCVKAFIDTSQKHSGMTIQGNDAPLLLDRYVEEAAREFGKPGPLYPLELLQRLMAHNSRSNIRELRAMAYDAVVRDSRGAM